MSQINQILPATNFNSPYYMNLPPGNCEPSEELAKRFGIYKHFLKQMIYYLKEISIIKDYNSKINYQLYNSIQFPSIVANDIHISQPSLSSQLSPNTIQNQRKNELKVPKNFFMEKGNKSIMDVSSVLSNYHKSLYLNEQQTFNTLMNEVVPNLEVLKKNLSSKIKELKTLKGEFNHNLNKEISTTGKLLTMFIQSVENFTKDKPSKKFKFNTEENYEVKYWDPFLLKIQLDIQLKSQLLKENYLKAAFLNLQNSAVSLEKIVYKDLQKTLSRFSDSINNEQNSLLLNLEDIVNQNPMKEWEFFVSKNSNFIKNSNMRTIKDIIFPYQDSVLTKCIRKGYLSKKNKYLKNYTKNYFVLSANFIHEFKSTDLSNEPISSIFLNDYKLEVNPTKNKFYLFSLKNSNDDDDKKLVFKSDTDFDRWITDLTAIMNFDNHLQRFKYIEDQYNDNTLTTSRSNNSAGSGTSANSSNNNNNLKINLDGLNTFQLNGIHTPLIQTPHYDHGIDNDELISKLNELKDIDLSKTPNESPNSSKSPNYPGDNPFEQNFNKINDDLTLANVATNASSNESMFSNNTMMTYPNAKSPSSPGSMSTYTLQGRNSGNNSGTTTPNFTGSMDNLSIKSPSSNSNSNSKHQEYLKKQKNFLKQQQDLIDLKLMQSESSMKNKPKLSLPNLPDITPLKSKSNVSLSSKLKNSKLGRVSSNFQDNSKFVKDQYKHSDSKKVEKDDHGVPLFNISSNH